MITSEAGMTAQPRLVSSPQKLQRKFKENKLSPEYLKDHCRKHDLYLVPKFNTILYLHHKETFSHNFIGHQPSPAQISLK